MTTARASRRPAFARAKGPPASARRPASLFAAIVCVFVTPSSLPAQTPNGPRKAPSATARAEDSRTASQPSEEARAAPPSARQKTDPRVARWVRALFWSVVLLVVLIFAAIAIVVFSRRYRRYLLRGRQAPTPSDDLWTMHRLPPEALSDLEPPPEDKQRP